MVKYNFKGRDRRLIQIDIVHITGILIDNFFSHVISFDKPTVILFLKMNFLSMFQVPRVDEPQKLWERVKDFADQHKKDK